MKIAYLLDSSCAMPIDEELSKLPNLYYLPLGIIINGERFLDNEATNNDGNIVEMIEKNKNVCTSQPTFIEVSNILDKIRTDGYDVVVCSLIGSGLSNSQNLVYSIAIEKKLTIIQLDSKGIGYMNQFAIKKFIKEAAKGRSLVEVTNTVQHMLDVSDCYGIADDISYLKKGGRLASSNTLLKSLMDYKKIMKCEKRCCGKPKAIAEVRTTDKALDKMIEIARENIVENEYLFSIAYYHDDALALKLAERLKYQIPNATCNVTKLSNAIGVHTGPHYIGLNVIRKI